MPGFASKIYQELGLAALVASPRDTKVLCTQRFVRLFAYGSSTLVLTLFLVGLGHNVQKTGLFMTLTLLGDVVISLILTVVADAIGRRRMLALGSLLMAASGVIFALFSQYWILVLASVVGVISPSGNEIGPFRAIEESTISQLVSSTDRSNVLAWYTLSGTAGAALGTIITGWVVRTLQTKHAWKPVESYRLVFWLYAFLGLIKFALSLILTSQCEVKKADAVPEPPSEQSALLAATTESTGRDTTKSNETHKPDKTKSFYPQLSAHTISLLIRLCALFALDSFGSGIASQAWLVYYFHDRFGLQEGSLGSLFFVTNLLSSASNLAAASIARRIGLIKTMVFTHLPASAALILLPIASNEVVAMTLLILRSSITSMDTAPRQAFLAAAVLPEERTAVMGMVNVVKTLSQSGGPIVTGILGQAGKFGIALMVGGACKCLYDVSMLGMFLGYRTIEEKAESRVVEGAQRHEEERVRQDPSNSSTS